MWHNLTNGRHWHHLQHMSAFFQLCITAAHKAFLDDSYCAT